MNNDIYSTNLSPNNHMQNLLRLSDTSLEFYDYHDTPYDSDAQYFKIKAQESGKWDISRLIRKNGTTYGWGGTTVSSLNSYLTGNRIRIASFTGTFPTNASTYYSNYYYDVAFSTIIPQEDYNNAQLLSVWAFVSTNVPHTVIIADGNRVRINSPSSDIKGKSVYIRLSYNLNV